MKGNFCAEHLPLTLDKDRIIQVFTNLIGNAFKFTDKGSVIISITDHPDFVECNIEDTGQGIAAEDLLDVFDKFKQFGKAKKGGEKGTGLGLSICKSLIELHHGHIKVESEPGKGTRFIFALPKKAS